jgi:DNA-binding NarL/FixJ family response regulator
MSPSRRSDGILRLIDETLSDHPLASFEGAASRVTRPSPDPSEASPLPRCSEGPPVKMLTSVTGVERPTAYTSDSDAFRWEPDEQACRITRAFLVDDHEIVRRGLRELLNAEADLEVVGEAQVVGEALRRIPLTLPDVVIVDIWVPDDPALDVCRAIRQRWPATRCLVLVSVEDDRIRPSAVGAASCIPRGASATEFVDGVRRVSHGERLACVRRPTVAGIDAPRWEDDDLRDLTSQERRILDLIGEGLTNREIGARMHLAEKTVKNYASNLLMKLGMCRRTEAAALIARLNERRRLLGG